MKLTGHKEKDSKYYDDIYKTVPQQFVPRQIKVAEYIDDYNLTIYDEISILDIGCGCGTFANLIREDWQYRGFDFSEVAISKAKENSLNLLTGEHDYNFWVGDIFNSENYMPLDYNVILCGQVLEHVDDLKLIEMFPKNVHIICTIPTFDDPAHVRYYDSVGDVYNRFCDSMKIEKVVNICDNQIMMVGMK